jgi:hypothetical protein
LFHSIFITIKISVMKQVSNAIEFSVQSSPLCHSISIQKAFTKRLPILILASIVLLVSSCHKDEPAKRTVPFKAEFQLMSALSEQGQTLIIYTTGTGDGTPVGKSSYDCHARVDATGYNDILVIAAADGSEIHAVGAGPGPVIDTTTGDVVITYPSTIKGGTGKFTGATGSFTVVGHSNLKSPVGTASLEGTITY